MKCRLGDLNIGDKFIKDGKMYLVIDLKLSSMSLTTKYPEMTCALNLSTYTVVCFNPDFDVEFESDNVFI